MSLVTAALIELIVHDDHERPPPCQIEERRRIKTRERQRQDLVVRRKVPRVTVDERPAVKDGSIHGLDADISAVDRQLDDRRLLRTRQNHFSWGRGDGNRACHAVGQKTGDDGNAGESAPAAGSAIGEDRQLRHVRNGEARRHRQAQGSEHREARQHAEAG